MKLINRSIQELDYKRISYNDKSLTLLCNGVWGDNAQLLLVDPHTDDPLVEIQAFIRNDRITKIWDIIDYASGDSITSEMIYEYEEKVA